MRVDEKEKQYIYLRRVIMSICDTITKCFPANVSKQLVLSVAAS